ncbi:MAG TPA: type II toxin-antitoxin system VapC family toxin [Verrucomicrobiota bacterium]|nr:VapC toxin family PIN domain ribonuclease [Verrucomicrobiales bacterium]HRI13269.1 type II toxin-antitoxin system VapC family toxin [Verrucomicrobiota bacterium]
MILTDVNLLLNAYNRDFPGHTAAREWWEGVVNDQEAIGLAWVTILGFLRIMTSARAMPNPMPLEDAVAAVKAWLDLPSVDVIEPGPRHAEILFRLLRQVGVAGDLTTDAHLAALAIEHQARLASTDTDFARFPGLKWFNPLTKRGAGR